jgi:hypothetical protein
MTSRPSTAAPILAVLAIVMLPLGAYVAGYFWLGELSLWPVGGGDFFLVREYPHDWEADAFWPAGKLESLARGATVHVQSQGSFDFDNP